MNNRDMRSLLAVIIVTLSLLAVLLMGCGEKPPSSSDNVVSDIVMTTAVGVNGKPLGITTVFSDNASTIICSFKVGNFPVGSKIKAEWIYVGGDAEVEAAIGKNTHIDSRNGTIEREGTGYTYASLNLPAVEGATWYKGDWKVIIWVDDQEKGTTYYKIE